MTTRHNGAITAALVLVTCVAIGCSDRGKPANKATKASKQTVPVTADGNGEPREAPVPIANAPVTFADGEAAYEARNYSEATRIFGQFAEQRPDHAWGHFMLGLSAWKGGDLAKAEGAFENALRLDPVHVKSLINLSRVLLDEKRPDDAIVRLIRASELEPDSNEVQRLFGRAYSAQGKVDQAESAYRHAIELDGEDTWAMNNLALLFIEQGRPTDALPLLARAVELRKDVPVFQNNLGMALEHTGRFSAAAVAYSGAVTADGRYEKARQNLARVEQVKENPQEPFDLEATAKRFVEELAAAQKESPGSTELIGSGTSEAGGTRQDETSATAASR